MRETIILMNPICYQYYLILKVHGIYMLSKYLSYSCYKKLLIDVNK